MKRLLSLLLIALGVIFLLSACGENKTPNDTGRQEETIPNDKEELDPDDSPNGEQNGSQSGTGNENQNGSQEGEAPDGGSNGEEHQCSFGEWVTIIAPTCTEKGIKKQTCLCGEYKIEDIKELGHKDEIVASKDATCTETGLTEGKQCTVCKTITLEQQVIPLKPHSEEILPGKKATCTETGLTEGKKCSVCKAVLLEQVELAVTEHEYVDRICLDCGSMLASTGLLYQLIEETNTYTLVGIDSCTDENIVIPDEYKGLPVTAIGSRAFRECTSITSVIIPNSVTTIGDSAF